MDWLPRRKDEILHMADVWIDWMQANTARNLVPQADLAELTALRDAAKAKWAKEQDPANKTPVLAQETAGAFAALTAKMRFIKRHSFLIPPLLQADFTALMLPLPDSTHSAIPRPEAMPEADVSFPGVHLVQLARFRPVNGAHSPNPKSDYGVAAHFGLTGTPTETHPLRLAEPPSHGNQLPYYHFVTDGKLLLDLEGESGSTFWYCLQYENQKGEAGPYSVLQHCVIP